MKKILETIQQYKQQYITLDDVKASIESAMEEHAIAFAIHYATGAISTGNTTSDNVKGDRMDVRYNLFLKHQKEASQSL
jgi:hypothetical protein